jgi:hypothetical protein
MRLQFSDCHPCISWEPDFMFLSEKVLGIFVLSGIWPDYGGLEGGTAGGAVNGRIVRQKPPFIINLLFHIF